MATANDFTNSVLDALSIYVNKATSSLKLDKTITATVTTCVSADKRQYLCSYNGGTITAYAYEGAAYTVNDNVFILVPQNDFTKKKYITGIATVASAESSENIDFNKYIILNDETMNISGNEVTLNCTTDDYIYLYAHDKTAAASILDYDGNSVTYEESKHYTNNLVTVVENELAVNLVNQNVTQTGIVVSVQTKNLQTQNKQGRYGVIINLVCTDKTQLDDNKQFVNKTISYELNSSNMSGNPYAYNNPSTQYMVFDNLSENYTFQYIKDIILYQEDFDAGSIALKNLQFLCLNQNVVTDNEDNNYTLELSCGGKNAFSTYNEDDQIILQATLKDLNANRSKEYKAFYYWGIQNASITSESDGYSEKLGEGWKLLDNGTGDQEKYKYIAAGSQNTSKSNTYKVVVDYKASDSKTITLTSQITLYNLACTVDVKLASSAGNVFNFKGSTTITCYINNKTSNFIDNENDAVFTFSWNRTEKKEAANINGTTKQLAQNVQSNVLEITDLKDLTENFVEYTCTVFRNSYSVGSASIILKDSATWSASGSRLEICNGRQTFQYDETGKSPTLAATPQKIQSLYVKFYDKEGNTLFDSSEGDKSGFNVQWRIPTSGTLIYTPTGAVQENDSIYALLDEKICTFTIADEYDSTLINNQIQAVVNDLTNNETFTKETSMIFTKIGENGTNGTTSVATIVPNESYDLPVNNHLALIIESDDTHHWNAIKDSTNYADENSPILQPKVYENGTLQATFTANWYPAGIKSNSYGLHMTFGESDDPAEYGTVSYSSTEHTFDENAAENTKIDTRIACAEVTSGDSLFYSYFPIPTIEYEAGYSYKNYPITIPTNKYLRNVYYKSNGFMAANPSYSQNQGAFYKLSSAIAGEAITSYTNWKVTGGKCDINPELRLSTSKGNSEGNKQVSTIKTAKAEEAETLAKTILSFVTNYSGDERVKSYLTSLMNKANLIISQAGVTWNYKLANLRSECETWDDPNNANDTVALYANNTDVKILKNYYAQLYDSVDKATLQNATAENTKKIISAVNDFAGRSFPDLGWYVNIGYSEEEKPARRKEIFEEQTKYDAPIFALHEYNKNETEEQIFAALPSETRTPKEFYNFAKKYYKTTGSTTNNAKTANSGTKRMYKYADGKWQVNDRGYSAASLNTIFREMIKALQARIIAKIDEYAQATVENSDGSSQTSYISNLEEIKTIYNNYFTAWFNDIAATTSTKVVYGYKTVYEKDNNGKIKTDKNGNKIITKEVPKYRTVKAAYYQNETTGDNLTAAKLYAKYNSRWQSIATQLKCYAVRSINDTIDHSNFDLDTFLNTLQPSTEDYTDGIYVIPPSQCTGIMCNDNVVGEIYATIEKNGVTTVSNQKIATITYPVHLGLNTYELQSLNGWDGHSIEINQEDNYIIAPQIAAGAKDTASNTFTGIVMGAISNPTEDGLYDSSEDIGLMGYADGEQSIFLDAKTGNAAFGLSSEDEGEGRIELVPGGVSKIGGWRIGNKFLANIVDGEYELRVDPDLRSIYYNDEVEETDTTDESEDNTTTIGTTNSLEKVRIPVDKGGVVLSADKPYIHIKSEPYTITELGDTSIAESDEVNQLSINDSLEVKIDPTNNSIFSIVQHTCNHQSSLQDNLYYGHLEGTFVKSFTPGIDDEYTDNEVLYTYEYEYDDTGNVLKYNLENELVEGKVMSQTPIYGSKIIRMHDDNIVENISAYINENTSGNDIIDIDGTKIANSAFNSSTGELTIKLSDSLLAQAKVDYTGTLDYYIPENSYNGYTIVWDDDSELFTGNTIGVNVYNYQAPLTFTWTIYDASKSTDDTTRVKKTLTSNQNQLILGTDEDCIGCAVRVDVTDANGTTRTRTTENWDWSDEDGGYFIAATIVKNEDITDAIEYSCTGSDYTTNETATTGIYKKCAAATQTIEQWESVDTNTEGYKVIQENDLTKSDFKAIPIEFPQPADDNTQNYAVRYRSTVNYTNHVFMPNVYVGTLDLLTHDIDNLIVTVSTKVMNNTYKDYAEAGVGLVLKLVGTISSSEVIDGEKTSINEQVVYISNSVTDWTNLNTKDQYSNCEFSFDDEIEPGTYKMYLHMEDEILDSEEWSETIVYEVARRLRTKKDNATGKTSQYYKYDLRIVVNSEDDLWMVGESATKASANYNYGTLWVGDVTARGLIGGATKNGLYYESELNINDGSDQAKVGLALSLTTPQFIRIYRRYYDALQEGTYSNYAVCLIKNESDGQYYRSIKTLASSGINELFEADTTVEYIDILPENLSEYYLWQELQRIGIDETGQLYTNGVQDLRVTSKYGVISAFGEHNHYGMSLTAGSSINGQDNIVKIFKDSRKANTTEDDHVIIATGDELDGQIRLFSSGEDGKSSLWYSATKNNEENIDSYVTVSKNGVTISSKDNIKFKLNGKSYTLQGILESIENTKKVNTSNAATRNNVKYEYKLKKLGTAKIPSGYGTIYTYENIDRSDWTKGTPQYKIWQKWNAQKNKDKFDKYGIAKLYGHYMFSVSPWVGKGGKGNNKGNVPSPTGKYGVGMTLLEVKIKNKSNNKVKTITGWWCEKKDNSEKNLNKYGHLYGEATSVIGLFVNGFTDGWPKWYSSVTETGNHAKPGEAKCQGASNWGKTLSVTAKKVTKVTVTNTASAAGQKIVQAAKTELAAWKAGKRGTYGSYYNSKYGFSSDTAWCANFVSWCIHKAGVSPYFHSACCETLKDKFESKGWYISNSSGSGWMSNMQPGDIIFYHHTSDAAGTTNHVAICISIDKKNKTYTQIGGNQGGTTGRRYVCKQVYPNSRSTPILGVGRYDYKKTSSATSNASMMAMTVADLENDNSIVSLLSDSSSTDSNTSSVTDPTEANDGGGISKEEAAELDPSDLMFEDYCSLDEAVYDAIDDSTDIEAQETARDWTVIKNNIAFTTQESLDSISTEQVADTTTLTDITTYNSSPLENGIIFNTTYSGSLELRKGIIKTSGTTLHTDGGLIVQSNFKVYPQANFYSTVNIDNTDKSNPPTLDIGKNYNLETFSPTIRVGNEDFNNGLIISNGSIEARTKLVIGGYGLDGKTILLNNAGNESFVVANDSNGHGKITFKGLPATDSKGNTINEDSWSITYDMVRRLNALMVLLDDDTVDKLLQAGDKLNIDWESLISI